jgi:hypothetical protein
MELLRIVIFWLAGTAIGTIIGIYGMKKFLDWRGW